MQKKILVVDDDHDIVEIVVQVLKSAGYLVIHTYSAMKTAEVAMIRPDLILLDDWLPDDLGTNLCLKLKSYPETAKTPVILFSAQYNVAENASACGADAYLAKPFDLDALEALVEGMI